MDDDLTAALDTISNDLFPGSEAKADDMDKIVGDAVDKTTAVATPAVAGTPPAAAPVVAGTPPVAAPSPTPATTPAPPPGDRPAQGTMEHPPRTWQTAPAAKWAAVDPEIKAEIIKREEDMFRGLEQYKESANFGKSIRSVIAPFEATLRQHNIDPAAQIQGLMHSHHTLAFGTEEQKTALLAKLANDYGVKLPGGQEDPFVDPAVHGLRKEVEGLKSTLTSEANARLQAQQAEKQREIEAFAVDPANVHFQTVLPDMVRLVETKMATSLKDAYEKAVRLNPQAWAAEQTRQQAEAAAKLKSDEEARTAVAKAAAATNTRTSAKHGSAAAPKGSMDETMQATLEAIKARS